MLQRVHEFVLRAPIPPQLRAQMHVRLDDIDARLDGLERRFSQELGEASRQWARVLVAAIAVLAASTALLGWHVVSRTLGGASASKAALRESNTRWELAASAGGLGVFEWNVEHDEFLLDARSLALCGWPGESAVLSGAQLCSSMHPDDQRPMREAAQRALDSGETWIERYRVLGTDGGLRHVEVNARMSPPDGDRPRRMVGVIRDVTEALQADRLRTEKAAAERARQARSEWLSRVSHDLRTPLNAILGFARLMASDAVDPLSPAQRARLRHVLAGGDRLLGLVDELQEISSVELGTSSAAAPEPTGRVLYVEDNAVNAILLEQLLSRWPQVELLIAHDGRSGLAMALAHRPDLVLLDMHLPDIDGLQDLDALRADARTAELPVLMVSASGTAVVC